MSLINYYWQPLLLLTRRLWDNRKCACICRVVCLPGQVYIVVAAFVFNVVFLFFCFVLAKLYRMVCLPGQVYIVVVCGLVVVVFVVALSLWKVIRILENSIKLTKSIQGAVVVVVIVNMNTLRTPQTLSPKKIQGAGLSDLQLSHSGPAKLLRWRGYSCVLTSRKGLRRRKRYKNRTKT